MTRQSKTMLQAVENIKRKAGVGESGRGVEERLEENMMKSGTLEQQNYAFFSFFFSSQSTARNLAKYGKHRKSKTIE